MLPVRAPRRLPVRCLAAALGLLTSLFVLAACGESNPVAVGDVVPARSDSQFAGQGHQSTIALPLGRLEVTLAEPTTELAADETRTLEALTAPAGATFLPISWQYDAGTFGDYADYFDPDATPVVDVRADGASYRLPAPMASGEGAESFYLLVDGDGADTELQIEYDGVTQTVDLATGERDAGRAAPLYDLAPRKKKSTPCTGAPDVKRDTLPVLLTFTCRVSAPLSLPYAAGSWADKGKSFTAVTVETTLGRWDETSPDFTSGATYYPGAVNSTFTLGGAEPALVVRDEDGVTCPNLTDGVCAARFHLVFPTPGKGAGPLAVAQSYDLHRQSAWGTAKSPTMFTVQLDVSTRLG